MLTPIHRAIGLEPGDLTAEMLQSAIDSSVTESADLDWKRQLYNFQNPKWQDEAAKDAAAMANSGGGWIIFGVDEDVETSAAAQLCPVDWNTATEQRIRQTTYARVGPPVLGIEWVPVEVDGGWVVAMHVPDSRDAPHFARKGENAFVAPIRNGPHTNFMSQREIELAFRRRFQSIEARESRLRGLLDQAISFLDPSYGLCLALAAAPIEPSSLRTPTPQEDAQRYLNLQPDAWLFDNAAARQAFYLGGDVRRALRGWRLRAGSEKRRLLRKSIHDDGVVLASYRFGNDGPPDHSYASQYPVGLPTHCMSEEIELAIADFTTLVRAHTGARNVSGGYQIRATLLGKAGEPIFIRTTTRFGFMLEVEDAEPIYVFQPVSTEFDPLASVDDLVGPVSDLALDIVNQGGVQYLRRLAEPEPSS